MPPSLMVMRIDVAPASRQFSSSSLSAEAGLCMISWQSEMRVLMIDRNEEYLARGYTVDN